ncbi:unnamed protein product [Gongylonema pulchrum]|uniref:Ion_trans_2 domain-containing protein n=1 Tax=Gongylonema pulchrum TaxID=637853 RepID=A0A183EZI9_9BILA|nr:unnamed protein product [Gongylonema pulchrum]
MQVVERWKLALELAERNFLVYVVTGDPGSDHFFRVFSDSWREVSHALFLCAPFLSAVLLLTVVRSYREEVIQCLRNIGSCSRCKEAENRVDYNTETMRSIIAEQTRARQFRNYTSNILIL